MSKAVHACEQHKDCCQDLQLQSQTRGTKGSEEPKNLSCLSGGCPQAGRENQGEAQNSKDVLRRHYSKLKKK